MPYEPKDIVTSEDEIRALQPNMHPTQPTKILNHLDPLCRIWIETSPFLIMATYDAEGHVDVSPKGDPAGFVKVLDPHTLAIPDRPGNHRFDSFSNLLQTGRIGLIFLVPNRNEVVRVNGSARIVRDAELLDQMQIKSHRPDLAVLISVEEAFYHCGKAIIRSRLWHPDSAAPIDALPSYSEALAAHSLAELSLSQIEERMAYNDAERLYKE
jgi:PPOX class probable FMN-dependent enzyme